MPLQNPRLITFPFKPKLIFTLAAGFISAAFTQAATFPPSVSVHTVTLGWNAVPQTGIQGYRIYVGSQSQQYSQTYDSGTNLSLPVNDLEFGKTYYFAVSAIGGNGTESPLSKELAVTIAPPPLPVGTTLATNATGQRGLQWSFPRSELGSSPEFIIQASSDLVNWTQIGTVSSTQTSGGDAQSVQYSWPIEVTGNRKFYRLAAKNWMGLATR